MEHRDLLKDQIEQIGKVLAQILSNFLGMKTQGQAGQGMEIASERLQSELDIEIDKIIKLTKKDTLEYLKNRKCTSEHLDILSEYLNETGREAIGKNKKVAKLMLEKAIELLDIADEISGTIAFERIDKKNEIVSVLKQYD